MNAARKDDSMIRRAIAVGAVVLAMGTLPLHAEEGDAAKALADRYKAMTSELQASPFGKPLVLKSQEGDKGVSGEVYAVVDHPFDAVKTALDGAPRWCDVLLLHLNTKHCYAAGKPRDAVLSMHVGKKYDQPLEDAYRLDFRYVMEAAKPDYLRARLDSKEGPMGTRDYRIVVEATPVDAKRTFLHFSYSYGYGATARFALSAYLGTVGREKIGFSKDRDNRYVNGVRGMVERNTMRYYLAIEATLDAQSAPVETRFDRRLHNWFSASERYARQLHEMNENEYIDMKHKEYKRLQAQS